MWGSRSSTSDDAKSTVTCPNGYFLSGCSAYTPWKNMDGSYFSTTSNNHTCYAQNGAGGNGIYAVAVCCQEYVLTSYI